MKFSAALLSSFLGSALFLGAQSLPVPADPRELVTGAIQVPSTPAERAAAFALLERAKQNADMHMPGTPPFNVKISFNASGNVTFTGPGSISEVWFSGRRWRYDQSLAGYSEARVGLLGEISAKQTGAVPLRVSMLRAAMFWPVGGNPSNSTLRTAQVQWNGKPAACFLLSGSTELAARGRQWEETEYCVDNASGLLQIYSRAPGTFVVYDYSGNLQFHGRQVPSQITIFVGGEAVLDGKVSIEDANPADPTLTRDAEMAPTPANNLNLRFPIAAGSLAGRAEIQPVIVNVSIDKQGKVGEAEISAASDPALGQAALDFVKKASFGPSPSWRQAYINVKFAGSR